MPNWPIPPAEQVAMAERSIAHLTDLWSYEEALFVTDLLHQVAAHACPAKSVVDHESRFASLNTGGN